MFVYLVVFDSFEHFIEAIFSKESLARAYAKDINAKRIKERKASATKFHYKYREPEKYIVEKWKVDGKKI